MIQLDPKFMSMSKTGKLKTQKKREKLKKANISNTGAMRKKLLNKIKDYQKRNEEKNVVEPQLADNEEQDFSSEFNKSLQFLSNLTSKNKKQTRKKYDKDNQSKDILHNSKVNHPRIELDNIQVSTELPKELLDDSKMNISTSSHSLKKYSKTPQYSCLKNGSKPTYREWKRNTQKNIDSIKTHDTSLSEPLSEPLNDRELALKKVREDFQEKKINDNSVKKTTPVGTGTEVTINNTTVSSNNNNITLSEPINSIRNSFPETEHRIKTKKYKLGKNKTHKFVGVLIKNRDTRKRVSKEKDSLKKKSILEVKNYLKKCNLLKSGSDAPPDVLRTMYEQAVLTGDVNNQAKDTLVHNYYNN